jgi:hypothetical protein
VRVFRELKRKKKSKYLENGIKKEKKEKEKGVEPSGSLGHKGCERIR